MNQDARVEEAEESDEGHVGFVSGKIGRGKARRRTMKKTKRKRRVARMNHDTRRI